MYLKIVCSWCGKLVRIKENKDSNDDTSLISHSICPDCSKKVLEETEKSRSGQPRKPLSWKEKEDKFSCM